MNRLVLKLETNALCYGVFPSKNDGAAELEGCIAGIRGDLSIDEALGQVLERVEQAGFPVTTEAVGIHVAAGGNLFPTHTLATPHVIKKLKSQISSAPMHLPAVLALISCCSRRLEGSPIVLFFETAFFTKLPACEYLYAISPDALDGASVRRYGYHGLYHEAAVRAAEASTDKQKNYPAKIISICLEPLPEIAAILDGKPLMVSGGATPLEGLPGQTSCEEIDSGVLLTIAREEDWGPEQLNQLLTQRSGMMALAGRPATIEEVLVSEEQELALAKKVLEYRILLRVGMALAAMDGVDRIIFSGRYAAAGKKLALRLKERLPMFGTSEGPDWQCYEVSLMRIMEEQMGLVLQNHPDQHAPVLVADAHR
jgi:acetate kinase